MKLISGIIKISRPDNFAITFIAVIVAALISNQTFLDLHDVLFGAFALAFACSAGNVINDIFDIEIDKVNRPDRVLPKEQITFKTARMVYLNYALLSVVLTIFINVGSFAFLVTVNILLYIYSKYLKNTILTGNILVSLLTMSALFFGAFLAGNIIGGLIPGIFAFFTNLIREILKDVEDIKGDASNNVVTFPKSYGISASINLIHILTITLILLTTVPFLLQIYAIEYFILIMPIVNGIFVYMLRSLREDQSQKNLHKLSSLIKLNMIFGIAAIYLGNL